MGGSLSRDCRRDGEEFSSCDKESLSGNHEVKRVVTFNLGVVLNTVHAGQGKCWINVSFLKSSEAAEKCHEQKDRTKEAAFFQLRGTHAGRKVPKGLASECLLQLT